MSITLSAIATKTGDNGSTLLGDGTRVSKDHARIVALGDVDELNAFVAAAAEGAEQALLAPEIAILHFVQHDLFDLGADLSVPWMIEPTGSRNRVTVEHVEQLNYAIQSGNAGLPVLRSFLLPGGGPVAVRLHQARTVCRRAERSVVALSTSGGVNPLTRIYLNRLSDLLFILARRATTPGREILWKPGRSLSLHEPPAAATTAATETIHAGE